MEKELELEDIVLRRDYKLRLDFTCQSCKPEDQWRNTTILGICLPGEEKYEEPGRNKKLSPVTWDDILHIKCIRGHITRPKLVCDRCNATYPHTSLICNNCEDRVTLILTIEEEVNSLKEQYRRMKRKKFDVTQLGEEIKKYESDLDKLGVKPCIECKLAWINKDQDFCKDCLNNG